MARKIGDVTIEGDYDGDRALREAARNVKEIEKVLESGSAKTGKKSGDAWAKAFNKSMRDRMSDVQMPFFDQMAKKAEKQGNKSGRLFSDHFGTVVTKNIKRSVDNSIADLARLAEPGGLDALTKRVGTLDGAMERFGRSLRDAADAKAITKKQADQLTESVREQERVIRSNLKVAQFENQLIIDRTKREKELVLQIHEALGARRNLQAVELQGALRTLIGVDAMKKYADSIREATEESKKAIGPIYDKTAAERAGTRSMRELRAEMNRVQIALSNTKAFNRYVISAGGIERANERMALSFDAIRAKGGDTNWIDRMRSRLLDLSSSVENSNDRMNRSNASSGRLLKSHVARTIAMWTSLVLAIGGATASLGSGVGAALTALISSLSIAVGGLAAFAGTALAGLAAQIAFAVSAAKMMETEFPAAAKAMSRIGEEAKKQSKAFAGAWGPALETFGNSLADAIGNSNIGEALGASMAGITQSFNTVINSPAFKGFIGAMETTIPNALNGIGGGVAGLTSGLVSMFTAAAPVLEAFSIQFSAWAEKWAWAMQAANEDGSLTAFFEKALESINAVLGVLGSLGNALGTVFSAGAETGNSMLNTLTGLFEQWDAWMQSIEGQDALATWFANGERIFDALLELAGEVGSALGDLVTPESIDRLTNFLGSLGDFMPMASQILQVFERLDVLNIFTGILNSIGEILAPLMPLLLELASFIGETLVGALDTLSPMFAAIGEALVPVMEVIMSLVEAVLPPLVAALTPIGDAIVRIIEVISPWIEILGVLLEAILPPLIDIIVSAAEYLASFAEAFLDTGTTSEEFATAIEVVGTVVGVIFEAIRNVIVTVLDIAGGMMKGISALLKGDFSGAFEIMQDVVRKVFENFGLDFDGAIKWVEDLFNNVQDFFGQIGTELGNFGDTVASVFDGVIGWISDAIGWFGSLFGAANDASGAMGNARGSSRGGGFQIEMAAGGILRRATNVVAGEAGPEAFVPLNRPLSQVSPDVRWISAIAQGKMPLQAAPAASGPRVVFEAGSVVVQGADDPRATAFEVMDLVAERIAS